MTIHKSYIWWLAPLSLLAAACDVYDLPSETEDGVKTPIELRVGGMDAPAMTRAVITDEKEDMMPFAENTSLYMLMKSENTDDTSQPALMTRTIMFALPQTDNTLKYSETNYSASNEYDKFVRFWDDCYARSAALSILAVCTPGMGADVDKKAWSIGGNATYANSTWTTASTGTGDAPYASIVWPVGNAAQYSAYKLDSDQSLLWNGVSFIKNEDLCFTNNVGDYTAQTEGDRRIKFIKNAGTDGGHFDAGKLVFYHALSKLTFRLVKGEGFSDSEFLFNTDTNIRLSNFYNKGTFDIQEGEFLNTAACPLSKTDISRIYQRKPAEFTAEETAAYKYILDALVIPGTTMTAQDNAVTFSINNNEYRLTLAQLYGAFSDAQKAEFFDSDRLKAGVHYVFTFTVGKTKISNITAQVVEWENVEADPLSPTNARIKLLLEERGEAQTSDVAFYKANDNKTSDGIDDNYTTWNWNTGYTNLGATYGDDHWTTNLFWQSSKDFYHFRALMPAATGVTTDVAGDNATLASGSTYTDVRWGAPMKDDGDNETFDTFKWTYDPVTNGFDNASHTQIYKAIGPTENPVKLILFHMMSDLTFNISTTTGADKVELCHPNGDGTYKRTRLDLVGFYNGGRVLLGTGLVKTDGSVSTVASPVNVPFASASNATQYVPQQYTFGAVPQDLTAVKLYITTPDNNQYIVDLKDVKATAVTTANIDNPYTAGTDGKYTIGRWYPGFKYVYSFTLKKTGIANLVATVVNWETITADNETVVIK